MATSAVYWLRGTGVVFDDSAGDVVLVLNNLATTVGRVSVRYDRGAGALPRDHMVRLKVQFATAPVVGETVQVYLSESDGTDEDGDVGAVSAALASVNVLPNLTYVGSLIVPNTSADTGMVASFMTEIKLRYFSVVVYNATADNLRASANVSSVTVIPIYPDVQASA